MGTKTYTMREIGQYIVEKYPESCLAHNNPNLNNFEWHSVSVPECVDFFCYEKLHWCGCGAPENAQKAIRDFLKIQDEYASSDYKRDEYSKRDQQFNEAFSISDGSNNPLLICLVYAIDAAEFTEHGSSISGAWLTEEGRMFLQVLNYAELDEQHQYTNLVIGGMITDYQRAWGETHIALEKAEMELIKDVLDGVSPNEEIRLRGKIEGVRLALEYMNRLYRE